MESLVESCRASTFKLLWCDSVVAEAPELRFVQSDLYRDLIVVVSGRAQRSWQHADLAASGIERNQELCPPSKLLQGQSRPVSGNPAYGQPSHMDRRQAGQTYQVLKTRTELKLVNTIHHVACC